MPMPLNVELLDAVVLGCKEPVGDVESESLSLSSLLQGVRQQRDEEMRLLTGVFQDFRGPQMLLWDPKDRRKLLLGIEDTFMG